LVGTDGSEASRNTGVLHFVQDDRKEVQDARKLLKDDRRCVQDDDVERTELDKVIRAS